MTMYQKSEIGYYYVDIEFYEYLGEMIEKYVLGAAFTRAFNWME